MNSWKTLPKRTTPFIILAGLILFPALLFQLIPRQNPDQNSLAAITNDSAVNLPKSKLQPAKPGLPVHLKIPSINVDAAIEGVGLTPDGTMDVTKEAQGVAWYKLGRRPGERGSAVIAGHYGWKNGRAAAFDNLSKLR